MRYITIFTFDIMAAIRDGQEVFMLDRADGRVYKCSELEVRQFIRVVDVAEKDKTNRYTFWRREVENGNDAL